MRISVKDDLRGRFGIPAIGAQADFLLKDSTSGFTNGSYGAFVREEMATANLNEFLDESGFQARVLGALGLGAPSMLIGLIGQLGLPAVIGLLISGGALVAQEKQIQRDFVKAMARNYGLRRQADLDMFDDYWHMIYEGRQFASKSKTEIESDLERAYQLAARVAAGTGRYAPGTDGRHRPVTWKRIAESRSASHYVIFSDIHFSALTGRRARLNYAINENLDLYVRVLTHYADRSEFCLVENGDIEECVIVQTDADDAVKRRDLRAKMPVDRNDPDWQPFLEHRYEKRRDALRSVVSALDRRYYSLIRDRFVAERGRYIRLTGNHDTYSEDPLEQDLLGIITQALGGHPVHDVLRIWNDDRVSHVVMHGHQFDTVSLQHGAVNYALSCGEVFSEATAWTNEGPDRFWDSHATCDWVHEGGFFKNELAVEEPAKAGFDKLLGLALQILVGTLPGPGSTIRRDLRDIVESQMKHEIAWEYFEHDEPVHALGLELLTGEDAFKFRHLSEIALVNNYKTEYERLPTNWPMPLLILGHTHEPRHNAVDQDNVSWLQYMNSGSAGRFHNLIWCVEIALEGEDAGERIVSWSRVGRELRRTVWRPVSPSMGTGTALPAHLAPDPPEIFEW